jgi:peptide/nickel transport system permease protein
VTTGYVVWVSDVFQGNFGQSTISQRDVSTEIGDRLGVTMELALLASAFSLSLAIPIGAYSALHQDRIPDQVMRFVTIVWLSMPGFCDVIRRGGQPRINRTKGVHPL